jgi:hypothetical protein
MADMNREEVDAKIGASEARADSKFATVIARLDALITEMREMRVEMSNIRISVILTVIASTLTIIFGVAGFNASCSTTCSRPSTPGRSEVNGKAR